MYQLKNITDTIAAISTPPGQGGIGIIRLSGKQATIIAEKMFVAKNNNPVSNLKSHTVYYGWIARTIPNKKTKQKDVIDEVLLTVMRAPKSYTREDVVEISSHGGVAVVRSILELMCDLGARLAEPGEFTKRAFLNGRIDLTQAEAVLDIIQAKTDAFLQMSTHQLKGELSLELEHIRETLMTIYLDIEAAVNFPEDEIEEQSNHKTTLKRNIRNVYTRINTLIASSKQGQLLRDGIKIVLCGKTNVGKSSLLNILLKTPRALVSDVAGTTRDTIEETAQIQGIPFQLVDTAGILNPRDALEKEAIRRSHMHMGSANIILLILDASEPLSQEDKTLITNLKNQNIIIVLNKCDLPIKIITDVFAPTQVVKISALNAKGIDQLEKVIVDSVWKGDTRDTQGLIVNNVRHVSALKEGLATLSQAQQILTNGITLEFISEQIKQTITALDNITGRNVDQDLLDSIFSQFCIGK